MNPRLPIILILCLSFLYGSFGQVIGTDDQNTSPGSSVEKSSLNQNNFNSDVDLFTGIFNSSYSLGSVSTPGGLNFYLSLHYSSTYIAGNTPKIASGIPYGEGWNLNIPTITISTEIYREHSAGEYCTYLNNSSDQEYAYSNEDGDPFWLSPILSIPGVFSGKLIFKYFKNDKPLFVPNAFEKYLEVTFDGNEWNVVLGDGTIYRFASSMQSFQSASKRRILNYNDISQYSEEHRLKLKNVIIPKLIQSKWYCTDIYNHNKPGAQGIKFNYEKYGEFDFFKEYSSQDGINSSLGVLAGMTSPNLPSTKAYTDILLKSIYSYDHYSTLEILELEYKSKKFTNSFQLLYPNDPEVYRLDSLYNYKEVYNSNNFSNWRRYLHTKHDDLNSAYEFQSTTNPYWINDNSLSSGYFSKQVTPSSSISFNHGFLESERISTVESRIPGDIYEIRTTIANHSFCNYDINICSGINYISSVSTSSTFENILPYNTARRTQLFTTFSNPIKWNPKASNSLSGSSDMTTSNFFSMPNLPDAFNGFNVQIGPSNSDNNFKLESSEILENGGIASFLSYSSNTNSFLRKHDNAPNNFGIGLPWVQTNPFYKDVDGYALFRINGIAASRFRKWWHNSWQTEPNEPTLSGPSSYLRFAELIRYSRNTFMLSSVKKYIVDGEFNPTLETGINLVKQLDLDYSLKKQRIIDNQHYQPGDQMVLSSTLYQNYILLDQIQEVPVNPTGNIQSFNISDFPTVYFEYEMISPFLIDSSLSSGAGTILTKITSPIGGITDVSYKDIDQVSGSYIIGRYRPQSCSNIVPQMGRNSAFQIYNVVDQIKTYSENGPRITTYEFSERVNNPIVGRLDNNHFDNLNLDFKSGFKITKVFKPILANQTSQCYTIYEHFTTKLKENLTYQKRGHLFGKLKTITEYDASNNKISKFNYEYKVQKAYRNGTKRIGGTYNITDNSYYLSQYDYYDVQLLSSDPNYTIDRSKFSPGSIFGTAHFYFSNSGLEQDNPVYSDSYFVKPVRKIEINYEYQGLNPDKYSIVTEYDYYDALADGSTNSPGFELLLSNQNQSSELQLTMEPSWNLYREKTYSANSPNSYYQTEYFYYYDLLNKFSPNAIYTQDINQLKLIEFCALDNSKKYGLRDIIYEQRTTNKSETIDPITKSEYYIYDCQWEPVELSTREVIVDESVDCNNSNPSNPDQEDEEICTTIKVIHFNWDQYQIPWGHSIIYFDAQPEGVYSICPFGAYDIDDENIEVIRSNPSAISSELPISAYGNILLPFLLDKFELLRYPEEYIFKDKLQLRSHYIQIDTLRDHEDIDFNTHFIEDENSAGILEFYSPTPGLGELYKFEPQFPFHTIRIQRILKRNHYGQPLLTENANDLLTRYVYTGPKYIQYHYPNCLSQGSLSVVLENSGLVDSIIVGSTLEDSLVTKYNYYVNRSLRSVIGHNSEVDSFEYDDLGRLKTVFKNEIPQEHFRYNQWNNDHNLSFEDRASLNFQETFILNNVDDLASERKRSYTDPLGREFNTIIQKCDDPYNSNFYNQNEATHSAIFFYDNWDRITNMNKPFSFTSSSYVGLEPRIQNPNTNPSQLNIEERTLYENDSRSRIIRFADYGIDINSINTSKQSYELINGYDLISELSLSSSEVTLLMYSDPNNYKFKKHISKDQDDKLRISYYNVWDQKIGQKQSLNLTENAVTLYQYDGEGNQIKVINPEKQSIEYRYNLQNLMYERVSPDAGRLKYMFDNLGQVVAMQDQEMYEQIDPQFSTGRPEYRIFEYDSYGRMIKQNLKFSELYIGSNYVPSALGYEDAVVNNEYIYIHSYKQTYSSFGEYKLHNGGPGGNYIQYPTNSLFIGNLKEKEWYFNKNYSDLNLPYTVYDNYILNNQNNLSGNVSCALNYGHDDFGVPQEIVSIDLYSYNIDGEVDIHYQGLKDRINFTSLYDYTNRGAISSLKMFTSQPYAFTFGIDTFYRVKYDYDFRGRLSSVFYGDDEMDRLADYQYNNATSLISTKRLYGICNGQNNLANKITYAYDKRDRLTTKKSFLEIFRLYYDDNFPPYASNLPPIEPNYNGNINSIACGRKINEFINQNDIQEFDRDIVNNFYYDYSNRLLSSKVVFDNMIEYGDSYYAYDKIGNINSLNRIESNSQGNIDTYSYQYLSGTNKLNTITKFINGSISSYTFNYNSSGSLITDSQKGISNIEYGRANLPYQFSLSNEYLRNAYDINDSRINKIFLNTNGVISETIYLRDIMGRPVVELEFVSPNLFALNQYYFGHDRLAKRSRTSASFSEWKYFDYDHLGNSRIEYSLSSECAGGDGLNFLYTCENIQDLFPYGKLMRSFNNGNPSKFVSTQNERDKELKLDFRNARYSDFEFGSFLVLDPLADHEIQISKSPYSYSWSNPIYFSDKTGLCPSCKQGKEAANIYKDGAIVENQYGKWKFKDGDWIAFGGELQEVQILGVKQINLNLFPKEEILVSVMFREHKNKLTESQKIACNNSKLKDIHSQPKKQLEFNAIDNSSWGKLKRLRVGYWNANIKYAQENGYFDEIPLLEYKRSHLYPIPEDDYFKGLIGHPSFNQQSLWNIINSFENPGLRYRPPSLRRSIQTRTTPKF